MGKLNQINHKKNEGRNISIDPVSLQSSISRCDTLNTCLCVQIMDAIRGRDAFNVADYDTSGQRVNVQMNEVQRLLLIICAVRARVLL